MRLTANTASGLLFVAVGAFALWYGWNYPIGTSARIGAGYFPKLVSSMLIVVGILVFLREWWGEREALVAGRIRPAVAILTGVFGFGLLLERAGFIPAALLLVFAARLAGDDFDLKEVLLLSAVLIVGLGAIFWYGLGLPFSLLPFGI